MNTYTAIIHKEDNLYVAECPEIGTASQGETIEEAVKNLGVEVDSFSGLLVDFAKEKKANVLIRGLRAVSDFEYEFQSTLMNRKLNEEIETVFIMTRGMYIYLSSSIVKEVASLGGDLNGMVPANVEKKLKEKFTSSYA